MSRYRDGDCDDWDPDTILAAGRWAHNARTALKGKRGRKVLAQMREALLALPEQRLIGGALCTVADVDKVLPLISDEDITADAARYEEWRTRTGLAEPDAGYLAWRAENLVETRESWREAYAELVAAQGCGVCAIGAVIWYRKVTEGMDPAEAFESLPPVFEDGGDPLSETAQLAVAEAGMAYTLAWELAYRNDETYELNTPEERYSAFLAWIEAELAEGASA